MNLSLRDVHTDFVIRAEIGFDKLLELAPSVSTSFRYALASTSLQIVNSSLWNQDVWKLADLLQYDTHQVGGVLHLESLISGIWTYTV